MAARVIAADVLELLETTKTDQVVENSFINTANIMVDEHLLGQDFSDALLRQIELYLAAHLLALSEEKGGMILDKLGDATTEWQEIYDKGFGSTRFGQMALTLDASGILAAQSTSNLRAEFRTV